MLFVICLYSEEDEARRRKTWAMQDPVLGPGQAKLFSGWETTTKRDDPALVKEQDEYAVQQRDSTVYSEIPPEIRSVRKKSMAIEDMLRVLAKNDSGHSSAFSDSGRRKAKSARERVMKSESQEEAEMQTALNESFNVILQKSTSSNSKSKRGTINKNDLDDNIYDEIMMDALEEPPQSIKGNQNPYLDSVVWHFETLSIKCIFPFSLRDQDKMPPNHIPHQNRVNKKNTSYRNYWVCHPIIHHFK